MYVPVPSKKNCNDTYIRTYTEMYVHTKISIYIYIYMYMYMYTCHSNFGKLGMSWQSHQKRFLVAYSLAQIN